MSRRDIHGCLPILGFYDRVTLCLEGFANQLPDLLFVFYWKNCFRSSACDLVAAGMARWLSCILNSGQVDAEGSSSLQFTLHENITAALLDDAVYGRKSQARALSLFLGCEEG